MNDLLDRKSGLPPTEKTKTKQYVLTYRIRGNCGYIIIIFLAKQSHHLHTDMVAYQGGVHTVSVGIVIILLHVTNITSNIRLNNAT